MKNEAKTADHRQTTFHSAEEAAHSRNGYWLTKRRDGRSDNWMIARYQGRNRSIVYRSCRTRDVEVAKRKLEEFAEVNPKGDVPPKSRPADNVYFIQANTGQIKIGIARDVKCRLARLRTMSPVSLSLLAQTDGGQPQEATYHARFAEHRLHGEWFSPHPDILAEIERLNDTARLSHLPLKEPPNDR